MAIDYQEILLEAVEIIANNSQLSNNNNDNSNSEKQENKPIPILNPFGQMIQQEKFDIEEGTPGESGNNQISYTWIPQHQTKYDLLGLECNITTNGKTTEDGAYGIKIYIKASNGNFEQTFDSSMMLGNPWNFKNMLQKQIFDLEEISNIQSIRITLYNESNTNVIFDNVFLRLGQSVDNLGESSKPLIIYSDNEPQYTSSADGKFLSGLPQVLYARWIYKKDNSYKAITHLNSEDDIPEGFTLRWYRWTPNSNFGDIYGGAYWSHINGNDNKFSYTIEGNSIDPRAEEERYKIIVLQNNLDSDEISVLAESEYYSIKNNIIPVNEQITNRQMKLSDDGKYHFYAWDQEIIDEEFWRSTVQRTATISFETLLGESDFYDAIKSITWRIPEYQTNYVGVATSKIESKDRYSQLTYDKAKLDELKGDGEISDALKESFTITYQISSHLYNDPMNKIQCIIDIGDGIEYLFEKEIEFDVSGSGGTDTSVIIRMVDEHGNVRAAITPGETLYLEAKVYNAEGEEITESIGQDNIVWEKLYNKNNLEFIDDNDKIQTGVYRDYISFKDENPKGSKCEIVATSWRMKYSTPFDWLFAVKVRIIISSLGEKKLEIQENYGVAVAVDTSFINFTYYGPKEILYSSSGNNPEYNREFLEMIPDDTNFDIWENIKPSYSTINKKEDGNWDWDSYTEHYSQKNISTTEQIFPVLNILNNQKTINIIPRNSFDSQLEIWPYGVCISNQIENNKAVVWIQPIIIGINRYFSSIINEWDGSLQINEDKNYILSSAYVAGGKNSRNQFTGVVMGELGTISNETISPLGTGLFGYYNGDQSFALTAQGGNGIFSGTITAKQGSNIAGWITTENVFGKLGQRYYTSTTESGLISLYYYGIGLNSSDIGLGKSDHYPLAIGPMTGLEGGDWSQAYFKVDGTGKLFAQGAEIEGTLSATKGQVGGWLIDSLSEDNFMGGAAFENSLYAEFIESDDYYNNTGIRKRVTILRPGALTDWAFVGLNIFGINNSYQEVFGIKHNGKILGQDLEINNSIKFSSGTGTFNDWIVSSTDLISSNSDFILSNVYYVQTDPVYIYKPQEYDNGLLGSKPPVARLLVGEKQIINVVETGTSVSNKEAIGTFNDNGEVSVFYTIQNQIVEEITKITYEISEKNKEDFYAIPDAFGTRTITIRTDSNKSIVTIKFILPVDSRTIYDQIRITINEYNYSSTNTNTKISYPLVIYSDGTMVMPANKLYLYEDDSSGNRTYYQLSTGGGMWSKWSKRS